MGVSSGVSPRTAFFRVDLSGPLCMLCCDSGLPLLLRDRSKGEGWSMLCASHVKHEEIVVLSPVMPF